MNAIRTSLVLVGLGVIVMLFWALGSGALGTGDQQLGVVIPGPAGGVSSSPSAGTTSPLRMGAAGSQQETAGRAPSSAQSGASQRGGAANVPSRNAPPLLLLTPASIVPENVVSASGQGFDPGEQVDVGLKRDGGRDVANTLAIVDKDGNFAGALITVTNGSPMGSYTVYARGRASRLSAEAPLRVAGTGPFVIPETYAGKGGSSYTISGGGFLPREVVALHFDSLAVDPLQEVIAAADGSVSMTATVPLAAPGDHAFLLVGAESNQPVRVSFSVVGFGPWVSPTDYSPRPEQRIGFAGHDFAPDEEVKLYRGQVGETPIAVARADGRGEFSLSGVYALPDNSVGPNRFLAVGIHSRTVVSATVNVLPFDPQLELTVYAGQPGTAVAFKGQGYAKGEMITAYIGGAGNGRQVARFQAGPEGAFEEAGGFAVPYDVKSGQVTISAVGERSRRPLEISFAVLPLTPWVGLSSYAGPPGANLNLSGHGFLPGENVAVHVGDRQGPLLVTAQADQSGAFEGAGSYVVPAEAKDKIGFLLVGESSDATASASFTVTEGAPASAESGGGPSTTPEQEGTP